MFKKDSGKALPNQSRRPETEKIIDAPKPQNNKEKNCADCGKTFSRPQDLKRHQRSHHESATFLCDLCGAAYRSRDGLNYHKTAAHPLKSLTTTTSFQCLDCDKTFNCSSRLKVHVKNIHKRVQKSLTCPYCDKKFKRTDVYKSHVALHGPTPKPFTCVDCPKTFSSLSNLRAHSRVHDASSALQCSNCSKKFNSRIRRDLHIPECLSRKTCTSCPKFSCKNNDELMEHMKRVHLADYALQSVFGESLEGLINWILLWIIWKSINTKILIFKKCRSFNVFRDSSRPRHLAIESSTSSDCSLLTSERYTAWGLL